LEERQVVREDFLEEGKPAKKKKNPQGIKISQVGAVLG
jgi:hypothetical protein